jgi:hypothetical protein
MLRIVGSDPTSPSGRGDGEASVRFTTYLLIAQSAVMAMTMAMNCNSTRIRIRFCERFGEPPRIMLMRPSSSTSATAPTAMGSRIELKKLAIGGT